MHTAGDDNSARGARWPISGRRQRCHWQRGSATLYYALDGLSRTRERWGNVVRIEHRGVLDTNPRLPPQL